MNTITHTTARDKESTMTFVPIADTTARELVESIDGNQERHSINLTYGSIQHTLKVVLTVTQTHQAPLIWLGQSISKAYRRRALNDQELEELWVSGNEAHKAFSTPYAGSVKNPDMLLHPASATHPSVFVEVGCFESLPDLHCDRNLLLQGLQDHNARLAMIIKWTPSQHNLS